MKTPRQNPSFDGGFMLLEVLVAILIFALGVLGLVGLQVNAVKQSGQTKFRADATLLANELIGRMWVSDRSSAALNAAFASAPGGAEFSAWQARVSQTLPGAADHPPEVSIVQVNPLPALIGAASAAATGLSASNRVTVTIRWKLPSDPALDPPRNLVIVTEIK